MPIQIQLFPALMLEINKTVISESTLKLRNMTDSEVDNESKILEESKTQGPNSRQVNVFGSITPRCSRSRNLVSNNENKGGS